MSFHSLYETASCLDAVSSVIFGTAAEGKVGLRYGKKKLPVGIKNFEKIRQEGFFILMKRD